MKICRFQSTTAEPKIGLVTDESEVIDLSGANIDSLATLLGGPTPADEIASLDTASLKRHPLSEITLLAPVDRQEIWAAGVTYFRSKTARMEESDFSATAYDKVYDAPRPEIFFKSLPEKTIATGAAVGIRKDATWNVPEPELALVMNARGEVVGYTIGNDMSSRDIEGENLLYLPQAKMYDRSCSLGPWIVVGPTEEAVRQWEISIAIHRQDEPVFSGSTSIDQIKRRFGELAEYLNRSQTFPHGSVLLTGTGIVPDDSFTLASGDLIEITVSGIGTLSNPVTIV